MKKWNQYSYGAEYRVRVDEAKGKVVISVPEGKETFEIHGYDLTITAHNGYESEWKKL